MSRHDPHPAHRVRDHRPPCGPPPLGLTGIAALLLFRFTLTVLKTLGICATLGLAAGLLGVLITNQNPQRLGTDPTTSDRLVDGGARRLDHRPRTTATCRAREQCGSRNVEARCGEHPRAHRPAPDRPHSRLKLSMPPSVR